MTNIGYTAHPSLDGEQLKGVAPVDFEVNDVQGIKDHLLATGRHRKTVHFTGNRFPDIQEIHDWRISYDKLSIGSDGDSRYIDYVDWQAGRPGLHTFCQWKMVRLSWTVILGQTEFFLPWRIANYHITLPIEDQLEVRIKPIVSTSAFDESSRLTIVNHVSSTLYDAATASSGEAHIDNLGTRFKVGDALAEGSVLYGSFVPLFNVFMLKGVSRKMKVGREGRLLILQEV